MKAPLEKLLTLPEVGRHYDELDAFYREVWGEHVHHGLWRSGREPPEQAARRLVDLVIRLARIDEGDAVCDVGSGYGATARILAKEHGAHVTALTVSRAQHDYACAQAAPGNTPTYLLCDWLKNDLPRSSFDAVIAIESASHMADRRRFFTEAYRVLRPGGRLVVCTWLAADEPTGWQQRRLLEPIVREGRLAGLDSAAAYRRHLAETGFAQDGFRDLSRQVRRTWRVCVQRLTGKLLTDRRYRRYLLDATKTNRGFVLALLRIPLAYWTGAMRYGVFSVHRPARETGACAEGVG